jgi:hypothetical protein
MPRRKLDRTQRATISAGIATSSVIDLGESGTLEAIRVPGGFKGSFITFQISDDNTTFADLYDADGSLVAVTNIQPDSYITLSGLITKGMRYVKLVSEEAQSLQQLIIPYIAYDQ